VLAVGFCLSFLSVQIAVPAFQLNAPRPARFGWHMWAARTEFPVFLVVMTDGTRQPADLATYVGLSRGEMDLTEALPPHLCRVVPAVAAVEVRVPGIETPRIHQCH
jgi:hypothetical protein